MVCSGNVIFKAIDKRQGGTFKNAQGQEIDYDASYVIKFDELSGNSINERKLKFPASNKSLYEKFEKFEPYTKVHITCDVVISNNACKLVPIDVNTDIED